MIKQIRFKKRFDVSRLQKEIESLDTIHWSQHYNKAQYEGDWSILPLRSLTGSVSDIISIHKSANSQNCYQDTALLKNCRYIQSILEELECEKTSVRLMKLKAGAIIKEHRDHQLSFEDQEIRLHIPVITSPDVFFYLEDERIIMKEGECWYLNLSLKHRVDNLGDTDRVHLVIDCIVNDWVKDFFTRTAIVKKEEENRTKQYSNHEKKLMIEQLRLMNTPVSHQLADNMEKELYA